MVQPPQYIITRADKVSDSLHELSEQKGSIVTKSRM